MPGKPPPRPPNPPKPNTPDITKPGASEPAKPGTPPKATSPPKGTNAPGAEPEGPRFDPPDQPQGPDRTQPGNPFSSGPEGDRPGAPPSSSTPYMPRIESGSKPPWKAPAPSAPGADTVTVPQTLEGAAARMDAAGQRIVAAQGALDKQLAGATPLGNDRYSAALKAGQEAIVTDFRRGTVRAPDMVAKTGTNLRRQTGKVVATDQEQADRTKRLPGGKINQPRSGGGGGSAPGAGAGGAGRPGSARIPGGAPGGPGTRPGGGGGRGGRGSGGGGASTPSPQYGPPPQRPPTPASIRHSAASNTHILTGDGGKSGGHRSGLGKPNKTEFPRSWKDSDIMAVTEDIARSGAPVKGPYPSSGPNGERLWAYDYQGTRRVGGKPPDVTVTVTVLETGEIRTAYPHAGPGVTTNPPSPPYPSDAPQGVTPKYRHPDLGGDGTWTYEGTKRNELIRQEVDPGGTTVARYRRDRDGNWVPQRQDPQGRWTDA
ncbi:hypothetical protein [Embleya sp. NPDC059237]|uniref:hypothetical protein n=1 Tax=Embleya sp. NPDC059237 TaxID=3346784 RepID=UPI0036963C27